MDTDPPAEPEKPDHALFSWPARAPENLLEATDLPQWENAYLLGSPGAAGVNMLLDTAWTGEPLPGRDQLTALRSASGEQQTYRKSFHINTLNNKSWTEIIRLSVTGRSGEGLSYKAFPTENPDWAGDRVWLSPKALNEAVEGLTADIQESPYNSVSDFFTRGKLVERLDPEGSESTWSSLLSLRAWFREAPAPVARGSAWILHLAVEARQDGITVLKTARIWLLETIGPSGLSRFSPIRFEWTDPGQVLAEG
jgi:hypothetical protein